MPVPAYSLCLAYTECMHRDGKTVGYAVINGTVLRGTIFAVTCFAVIRFPHVVLSITTRTDLMLA